jgi:hypothetical protein
MLRIIVNLGGNKEFIPIPKNNHTNGIHIAYNEV